jgi:hypothetical protein
MLDKLKFLLDDMVAWNDLSREDANLIYLTVSAEYMHMLTDRANLQEQAKIATEELEKLKKFDPTIYERMRRKENNDRIIKTLRLKKK